MMDSGAPASFTMLVSIDRGTEGKALATSTRATYPSCVCRSFSNFVASVVVFLPCNAPCCMSRSPGVMALAIHIRRRHMSILYMAVDMYIGL